VASLLTAVKALGAPGSIPFLILCCLVSLLLLFVWPRSRRLARAWLGVVLVGYLMLSLPVVAGAIAGALPRVPPERVFADGPVASLIVFDGDNRHGRVREAKRIYDLARPETVWLLGDAWMWDALWRAGVPYDAIKHDPATPTTRHQIAWVQKYMSGNGGGRAVVVASRLQMPRIAALTETGAIAVLLAPSPADTEPGTAGLMQFVPTYYALRISRDALYEHAALVYYERRGWIADK
jgi:hypothetical protein